MKYKITTLVVLFFATSILGHSAGNVRQQTESSKTKAKSHVIVKDSGETPGLNVDWDEIEQAEIKTGDTPGLNVDGDKIK